MPFAAFRFLLSLRNSLSLSPSLSLALFLSLSLSRLDRWEEHPRVCFICTMYACVVFPPYSASVFLSLKERAWENKRLTTASSKTNSKGTKVSGGRGRGGGYTSSKSWSLYKKHRHRGLCTCVCLATYAGHLRILCRFRLRGLISVLQPEYTRNSFWHFEQGPWLDRAHGRGELTDKVIFAASLIVSLKRAAGGGCTSKCTV